MEVTIQPTLKTVNVKTTEIAIMNRLSLELFTIETLMGLIVKM